MDSKSEIFSTSIAMAGPLNGELHHACSYFKSRLLHRTFTGDHCAVLRTSQSRISRRQVSCVGGIFWGDEPSPRAGEAFQSPRPGGTRLKIESKFVSPGSLHDTTMGRAQHGARGRARQCCRQRAGSVRVTEPGFLHQ